MKPISHTFVRTHVIHTKMSTELNKCYFGVCVNWIFRVGLFTYMWPTPAPSCSLISAPPTRLYTLFTNDDYSSLIVDFPWEQRPPQPPPPAFIMMPDHLHCLQLSNTNILLSNISNIMHATNLNNSPHILKLFATYFNGKHCYKPAESSLTSESASSSL